MTAQTQSMLPAFIWMHSYTPTLSLWIYTVRLMGWVPFSDLGFFIQRFRHYRLSIFLSISFLVLLVAFPAHCFSSCPCCVIVRGHLLVMSPLLPSLPFLTTKSSLWLLKCDAWHSMIYISDSCLHSQSNLPCISWISVKHDSMMNGEMDNACTLILHR